VHGRHRSGRIGPWDVSIDTRDLDLRDDADRLRRTRLCGLPQNEGRARSIGRLTLLYVKSMKDRLRAVFFCVGAASPLTHVCRAEEWTVRALRRPALRINPRARSGPAAHIESCRGKRRKEIASKPSEAIARSSLALGDVLAAHLGGGAPRVAQIAVGEEA
jgi:hypothetical protein